MQIVVGLDKTEIWGNGIGSDQNSDVNALHVDQNSLSDVTNGAIGNMMGMHLDALVNMGVRPTN